MSQENVEIVRRSIAAFQAGGPDAVADLAHPDIEFVTSPEMPDAGTYRGEAARRWMRNWVGSFEQLVIEARAFLDAGDKVVVEMVQRGRPRESTTEVEGRWWWVYTLRDRTVVRMEGFPDREQALEAVELRE